MQKFKKTIPSRSKFKIILDMKESNIYLVNLLKNKLYHNIYLLFVGYRVINPMLEKVVLTIETEHIKSKILFLRCLKAIVIDLVDLFSRICNLSTLYS
ncbi:RNA polymerase subunit 11 (nucleomorph) [Bigelowiella natans]|uniref:RNA polymerase subunit 11 n=1 Tax=Bigelowiella natans TaxID=227086 RepID=Q3LWC9_BIGNA|nr:RNA polymerase subunit 11 [Bigelowiella natans]ABA27236.1 RNA polymerase subunit 11 [Bigelowiella natans]